MLLFGKVSMRLEQISSGLVMPAEGHVRRGKRTKKIEEVKGKAIKFGQALYLLEDEKAKSEDSKVHRLSTGLISVLSCHCVSMFGMGVGSTYRMSVRSLYRISVSK